MPRSARAFEAIHAIADKHAPAIRRAFVDTVAAARGGDLRRRLQAALDRGQLDQAYAIAARAWETIAEADLQLKIAEEVLATLQQAGQVTQDEIAAVLKRVRAPEVRQRVAPGAGTVGRFDITNPRAIAWARERSATLIRDLNEEQQQAIRQALERTLSGQMPTAKLAKEIQQTIGLLPSQEAAAANFRRELEALRESVQPVTRTLRVGRVSNRGLTQAKIDAKVEAYRTRLLRQRAALISRTESIASANAGQQIAWEIAREKGTLPASFWKEWITTPDDRLCFVAGTLVATPSGAVPIEALRVGDIVDTHIGPRRVTATQAHVTRSALVRVSTATGSATSTADHPYLVIRRGVAEWCFAADLKEGDLVCQMECVAHNAGCAERVYVSLSDPHDMPTLTRQPSGLPGITPLVPVPVVAVCFKRDAPRSDQEVHAVASDAGLLDEVDPPPFKFLPNRLLQQGLSRGTAIAGEGTEPPCGGVRLSPDRNSTGCALDGDGWPATTLGTILQEPALIAESSPATRAFPVSGQGSSACQRAHGVAVSDDRWYRERVAADGARLLDHLLGSGGEIAGSGTETSNREVVAVWRSKDDSTLLADEGIGVFARAQMEALGGAILGSPIEWLTTPDAGIGHCSIVAMHTVFSLEIEEARTFFAAGVLVHNCPICLPMDGQQVPMDQPFNTSLGPKMHPPMHPRCRCAMSAAEPRRGRRAA